jgi:hypothetical protein
MTEALREHEGPIHEALEQMYAALGDRPAFNRHLHPSLTLWEDDAPGPLMDRDGLDRLRDSRGQRRDPDADLSVHPEDVLVDRWPGVAAVARYVLVARSGATEGRYRCTDVFTWDEGQWRIVHRQSSPEPAAARGG